VIPSSRGPRHHMPVRRGMLVFLTLAAAVLAGCGASHPASTGPTRSTPGGTSGTGGPTQAGGGSLGAEGIPIEKGPSLAPATTTTPGTPVDGIKCLPSEQVVYHIHAHLQVFV